MVRNGTEKVEGLHRKKKSNMSLHGKLYIQMRGKWVKWLRESERNFIGRERAI